MTTKKILRRGIPFSAEVAPLVARMPAVDEYYDAKLYWPKESLERRAALFPKRG